MTIILKILYNYKEVCHAEKVQKNKAALFHKYNIISLYKYLNSFVFPHNNGSLYQVVKRNIPTDLTNLPKKFENLKNGLKDQRSSKESNFTRC